ncbi:MAG: DnaJ C-terminal domain-containing protein [Myxococcota bacterium]
MTGDLYTELESSPSASPEQLRSSYKKLIRENHPDLHPNDEARHQRFRAITAAFDVLSDPKKRALYDRFGRAAIAAGFDPVRLESIGPGADVRLSITLSFVEAANGTQRILLVPRREGASGPVTVRIPPGVKSAQTLRVPEAGEPGRPPGTLWVDVTVAKHPLFERIERDVRLQLPVSLRELVCGAEVMIPTPSGRVAFRVPPRCQPGQVIRLPGAGIAAHKDRRAGDLLVKLKLVLPFEAASSGEGRALLEQLDRFYKEPVRDGLFIQAPGSSSGARPVGSVRPGSVTSSPPPAGSETSSEDPPTLP